MALGDVTITDANTSPSVTTGFVVATVPVQIGEAVTTKMTPLYFNSADSKYYKCDSTDSAKYKAVAFSWDTGSTDDYIIVVTAGKVELGAILTKGRTYVVSSTAGLIMLDSSLTTNDYSYRVGTADSTSVLNIDFKDTSAGVAI